MLLNGNPRIAPHPKSVISIPVRGKPNASVVAVSNVVVERHCLRPLDVNITQLSAEWSRVGSGHTAPAKEATIWIGTLANARLAETAIKDEWQEAARGRPTTSYTGQ